MVRYRRWYSLPLDGFVNKIDYFLVLVIYSSFFYFCYVTLSEYNWVEIFCYHWRPHGTRFDRICNGNIRAPIFQHYKKSFGQS